MLDVFPRIVSAETILFLNLALFTVIFDLYFINLNSGRGNYSREETIQGRKLFAEIRYLNRKAFGASFMY